jgi:hypothetical protein
MKYLTLSKKIDFLSGEINVVLIARPHKDIKVYFK